MKNIKINKMFKITTAMAFTLSLVACGGSVGGSDTTIAMNLMTVHDNVSYGTVRSPQTSKVWLDRNLGASRVCSTIIDSECYGGFYQWGRDTDGHQLTTSTIVTTQATDIQNVGHADYIDDENGTFNDDWASVADTDGSLRSFQWSKIDGSSVCPVGFRVPTLTELQNESFTDSNDSFNSFLKIPTAGRRDSAGLSFTDVAVLWASDVNETLSSKLITYESNNTIASGEADRVLGSNVRCIKD